MWAEIFENKTELFASCLFFMYLYLFSIFRVQINCDFKNSDNSFVTVLALISKLKPTYNFPYN